MDLLPPFPGWDGLHPLVIHFPIALLLVAPLLVVAGLVSRTHGRAFLLAALALMLLGATASWVAVGTGQAAGEMAERVGPVEAALEHHEELGETTRNVFTALTLVFAVLVLAPRLLRREPSRIVGTALLAVFLALYAGGALVLVRTAHQGGLLVHEYGVHAMVADAAGPVAPAGDSD